MRTAPEAHISALIPEGHPLVRRISAAYERLSDGQRRVVGVMLERPHEAAFLSAAELGARASVSDSTVVRLPAALGYAGYPELRQELQSILSARIAPVDLLRQRRGEASDVAHSVAVEIDNLQTVVSSISPETIERACAMVIRAKRVFVMGLRGAFGVAHQFAYLTQQELGTITLLSSLAATSIDQLSNLNSRDLFVAFSAARYARETVRTAEYAAKAGVPVIAITDNALSPLSRAAVVTIAVPFRSTSFFPSYVAALAVVQLIAARISRLREERVASRLTRIDELADEFEVLLERGDDGA